MNGGGRNSEAALGFAHGDADGGRRGRAEPGPPLRGARKRQRVFAGL